MHVVKAKITPAIIASAYCRKSNEQRGVSEDAKSVARQIAHCREYAATHGWIIPDEFVFVDDGISGSEFENRPGLQKLLAALKPKPPFSKLVIMQKDRLGREQYELGYTMKRLSQAGLDIWEYLSNRCIDLSTPTAKLVESIGGHGAEYEKVEGGKRTRDGLLRKFTTGHCAGGSAPVGYRRVPTFDESGLVRQHVDLVIDPTEARLVLKLFKMFDGGLGIRALAHKLNALGVVPPRCRKPADAPDNWAPRWNPQRVWRILTSGIYSGKPMWGRRKKSDAWGTVVYRKTSPDTWITRDAPELRIVPPDLAERVRDRLAERAKVYVGDRDVRPLDVSKYILSGGLARCYQCSANLIVHSYSKKQGKLRFYRCCQHHLKGTAACSNNSLIPMRAADRAVLKSVARVLERFDFSARAIRAILSDVQNTDTKPDPETLVSNREIAALEAEVERLTTAIAQGGDIPVLVGRLKARQRELDEARALRRRRAPVPRRSVSPKELQRLEDVLRLNLEDVAAYLRMKPELARNTLRTLLSERITFSPRREDARGRYWEFSGTIDSSILLAGETRAKLSLTRAD